MNMLQFDWIHDIYQNDIYRDIYQKVSLLLIKSFVIIFKLIKQVRSLVDAAISVCSMIYYIWLLKYQIFWPYFEFFSN